jgi:hypothetical protein
MATISEFTVGNAISVLLTDDAYTITDKPAGSLVEQTGHSPVKALVSYSNIWKAHLGVFSWQDGSHSVQFTWSPEPVPPPFNDVTGRVRHTMKKIGGRYVMSVRAARLGDQPRPTLSNIDWDELNQLLGTDARKFFESFGGVEFSTYGDLVEKPGSQKNAIGARVSPDSYAVLIAMHVATRPLAVLKGLKKQ